MQKYLTLWVHDWTDACILNLVQNRCKNFPCSTEFVIADECSLIAFQDVKDETGVSIWIALLVV